MRRCVLLASLATAALAPTAVYAQQPDQSRGIALLARADEVIE